MTRSGRSTPLTEFYTSKRPQMLVYNLTTGYPLKITLSRLRWQGHYNTWCHVHHSIIFFKNTLIPLKVEHVKNNSTETIQGVPRGKREKFNVFFR